MCQDENSDGDFPLLARTYTYLEGLLKPDEAMSLDQGVIRHYSGDQASALQFPEHRRRTFRFYTYTASSDQGTVSLNIGHQTLPLPYIEKLMCLIGMPSLSARCYQAIVGDQIWHYALLLILCSVFDVISHALKESIVR